MNTNSGGFDSAAETACSHLEMTLPNALRVKSAEFWLKLGQPFQAMMELEKLPESAKKHCWVMKVLVAATHALREKNELVSSF